MEDAPCSTREISACAVDRFTDAAPVHNQFVGFQCQRQAMGVTAEEIAMVKESFAPIFQNADESGKIFFKRLFELYPVSKRFFNHLSDSGSVLEDSPKFIFHRTGVIVSFGTLLNHLSDGDTAKIDSSLTRLARIHKNWDVRPEHVDYITKTMLDIIQPKSGSALENAWINVLDELMGSLEEKLQAAWN